MSGNIPYIGSKISLITTSDIRYEGILYTLNREESTIAVQNVRSFGTEGRRNPEVPRSNEIYDYIIFRGKDLKDLTVLQSTPDRPVGGGVQAMPSAMPSAGCGSEYMDSSAQHGGSLYSTGAGAVAPPMAHQGDLGQHAQHHHFGGMPQQAPPQQPQHQAAQHAAAQAAQQAAAAQAAAAQVAAQQAQAQLQQRQNLGTSAPPRNGYPAPPSASLPMAGSYSATSYPSPTSSGSRMPEKPYGAGAAAAVGGRQSFPSAEPHAAVAPSMGAADGRSPLYEDGGVGLPAVRTDSDEAKAAGAAARGSSESKDRSLGAEPKAKQEARGRGKGGAQKKTLYEVLRFHPRAQELITKTMRSQGTASIQPAELRSMSEMNPCVYHFYLDFANYCCPSHMVQSDEQQWESLCKALKKHFEKEFGASQNQKPPQPQRPNNTLGDFITIEANSKGKKNAKVPARTGGRAGRGGGRGDKKEADGPNSGEFEGAGGQEEAGAQSSSWVCARCTLRNEALLLECAACGTSKQEAALWAEFPPLG